MAMFLLEISFLLALAVLAAGVALWHQGRQATAGPLRIVGVVLVVGAVLTAVCTVYYGLRYQVQGDFDHAYAMHPPFDMGRMRGPGGMMERGGMMGGGMMGRGGMMGGGTIGGPGRSEMGRPDAGEEMARPPAVSDSEHEAHHPEDAAPR